MSSVYGQNIKVSIFGQSHGEAIGVVIDGLPCGEPIDTNMILDFLSRRKVSNGRCEEDNPIILSGIVNGKTCGAPLCAVINNTDCKSEAYDMLKNKPRPSHADFAALKKYGGDVDLRGGGHFSGRLTAPLCFAGAVAMQILMRKGIVIGGHILSVNNVYDSHFDALNPEISKMQNKSFPVLDNEAGEKMQKLINSSDDSLGGIVECAITGVKAGFGEPMFDGVENKIAAAVFGIPAVKGIEFGAGFKSAQLLGSENNDEFYYCNDEVKTRTNNHGGILGGITSGMPIIFSVAFKPAPSIKHEQNTVDLALRENAKIKIGGRHDICFVQRAVPCIEAAAAIAILDIMKGM